MLRRTRRSPTWFPRVEAVRGGRPSSAACCQASATHFLAILAIAEFCPSKRLGPVAAENMPASLLTSVAGVSSQDREQERPSNTLVHLPSPLADAAAACQTIAQRFFSAWIQERSRCLMNAATALERHAPKHIPPLTHALARTHTHTNPPAHALTHARKRMHANARSSARARWLAAAACPHTLLARHARTHTRPRTHARTQAKPRTHARTGIGSGNSATAIPP